MPHPGATRAYDWWSAAVLVGLSVALPLPGRAANWMELFIFTVAYVAGSLPAVLAVAGLTLLQGIVGWLGGLATAIRRAVAGERVVDPGLAVAALSEGNSPLTEREREVLAAAAQGASLAEIAQKLSLSEGAVRNYLSLAIQKLGARNRYEAGQIAEQKGWL